MARTLYEVRVRECIYPGGFSKDGRWIEGKYVKKSKFYLSSNPGDAARKYKGKGLIMWVEKIGIEKRLGVGEFFTLGDTLLRDLRKGGGLLEEVSSTGDKAKRRLRRGYNIGRREERV